MIEGQFATEGTPVSRPPVSIAMATFNGARFIEEQLESFLGQTVLPAELVVTDDGSTDATLEIVRAFAARAPFPVHLESNPQRLGFKGNFMKAASLCKSDLIAFSDQDDVWLPPKIEASLRAFEDPTTLLAYHDATVVKQTMEPIGALGGAHAPPQASNRPLSLNPWLFSMGFTITFRRSLLRFSDLWPRSADFFWPDRLEPHDQWVFFLANCLGNIRYLDAPLVLYRQHDSNHSGWTPPTPASLRAKWTNILSTDVATFKLRELAAKTRATLLEVMEARLEAGEKNRAREAARRYRDLAEIYRLRQQIYESPSLFGRVGALSKTTRIDGYRPKAQWGAGRNAFIRDLIRGVCLPAATKPPTQ